MISYLLMAGLITFVLTYFLRDMEGPWRLFERVRRWIGAETRQALKQPDGSYEWGWDFSGKFFGKLFRCPWCLATWVAMGVAAYICIIAALPWYWWFALWLSAIGLGGSIYKFVVGGD